MGHIYALVKAMGSKKSKILKMLVDTGSTYSMIDPKTADEIGVAKLPYKVPTTYANRTKEELDAGAVIVEMFDRRAVATLLIRECDEPLLGAETLEALGLRVDPATGRIEPSRSYAVRA
jgi:predicted aspartyl protease